MMAHTHASLGEFQPAARFQEALTAGLERKALCWMAVRTPAPINSDHLTALGFAAQALAGASCALSRWNRYALIATVAFIALNWLGDSLDGTLARIRHQQRPRYGFYVDHITDTIGSAFLMIGLALSGYLHWQIAMAMLVAFLVLSVETYLATYSLGRFQLSHGLFGPTEIRILLVIGTVRLLVHPGVRFAGHEFLLFDVGGGIAAIGMTAMAVVAAVRHTMELYRMERLS